MSSNEFLVEASRVGHRWGWFLFVGILLLVVGAIALVLTPAATLGTVIVFGWLLCFTGIIECIHAFQIHKWTGFFLYLLAGVLALVVGLLVATHPVAGALACTLLFTSYFVVIGIFQMIATISLKFPGWGWSVFNAVVTFVLGILLWLAWPSSSVWFIGLAVGIAMILRGWSFVIFAFAIRRFSTLFQKPAAA
jgi:uncharacterized membrane protein HdeD (DUF308 family)